MNLRPTHLLLGVGALALAFAIGAGVASGGSHPTPAAATVADDSTEAASALGLGADAALVAAVGVDPTTDLQAPAARRGGGILRAIIGKTERAEITVSTADGQKNILYVRGTIGSASVTTLTITLKDGTKQAFALDATTVVRSAGKIKAIADIPTGGRGLAVGVKNADGTYTAKFVRFAPAS